jgi:hypothetical protein
METIVSVKDGDKKEKRARAHQRGLIPLPPLTLLDALRFYVLVKNMKFKFVIISIFLTAALFFSISAKNSTDKKADVPDCDCDDCLSL